MLGISCSVGSIHNEIKFKINKRNKWKGTLLYIAKILLQLAHKL